ncbi:MAG: tRNA pseudouridine synthase A [Saprospiraceae bacterium]|nr:tRNA pseudouridine synthase A [Saprospiraceae bacterium]
MKNIRLKIEYDGTLYKGWQIQRPTVAHSQPTVQETVANALCQILQHPITLIGSGRTDAGVHAKAQYAHFKTTAPCLPAQLQRSLNAILPSDIRIKGARYVGTLFHSQYSAKSKRYRYSIMNQSYCPVFLRHYVYVLHVPLDVELMRREAASLLGRHDFTSFQSQGSAVRDPVRTITKIAVCKKTA